MNAPLTWVQISFEADLFKTDQPARSLVYRQEHIFDFVHALVRVVCISAGPNEARGEMDHLTSLLVNRLLVLKP